jgi:hypothetical protein
MSYNDESDELTGDRNFLMASDEDEEAEPIEEGDFGPLGDIEGEEDPEDSYH